MHKGIIILTKAETKEEAIERVIDFLGDYGECGSRVYDWYELGGRWNTLLDEQSHTIELRNCIKKVKDYVGNLQERIDKEWKEANEWKDKGDNSMYGYCLQGIGKRTAQDFYDECDVYNIEKYNYNIPNDEEQTEYFATVVDIHS